MPQRILVTNDDGIDGEGLRVLTATLVDRGYSPLVVAPNRDYSGAGGSLLSLDEEDPAFDQSALRYETRTLAEAPDAEAYAIHGPPALCALLTVRGAFGEVPTAVISGINLGLNVGPAILHSGTVGAAMTAGRAGLDAVAVSAQFDESGSPLRYDTAASLAVDVLEAIAGSGRLINLNVPLLGLDELRGVRGATVASDFAYRSKVDAMEDGVITRSYERVEVDHDPSSDAAMVAAGYAAVTDLTGVSGTPSHDLERSEPEAGT